MAQVNIYLFCRIDVPSHFVNRRIFRTDYGHTEVAAHFGSGTMSFSLPTRTTLNLFADPREYCISTKEFVVDDGKLKGLNTGMFESHRIPSSFIMASPLVYVEWTKDSGGRWKMEEVPGSEKFFPAQLVFLALGFLGPETQVIKGLGVKQDARSNIQTSNKVHSSGFFFSSPLIQWKQKFATNIEGVFAAGDCRRGQSLIVWGIK
jgi:NADPH-dependent glutamate synthase beta chain and related oxidoreductases